MQTSNSNPIFSTLVSGLDIEVGSLNIGGLRLRKFQEDVFAASRTPGTIILDAPTGSGKTLAMLLAARYSLEEGMSAFILYPTKALIDDQLSSMEKLARAIGVDAPIVKVDSNELTKIMVERGFKTHGEALLHELSSPSLVLTNPDIVYTILTMRYRRGRENFQKLFSTSTICVDELHLFWGAQFQVIYTMLNMLSHRRRIVISTATHDREAVELLKLLPNPSYIRAREEEGGDRVRHETELRIYSLSTNPVLVAEDEADQLAAIVADQFHEVEEKTLPRVVVIVNSIAFSEILASRLKTILGDASVSVINSLTPPEKRSLNAPVVVGTSAIEVGVDFDTPALVFEANNAPSFIQRLGRVARKRPGIALAILPYRTASRLSRSLKAITEGEKIPYRLLVDKVKENVSPLPSMAGFIKSPQAAAAQIAIAYAITSRLGRGRLKIAEYARIAEEMLPEGLRGHVAGILNALKDNKAYTPLTPPFPKEPLAFKSKLRRLAKSYEKIGVRGAFTTLQAFFEQHGTIGNISITDLPKLDFDYAQTEKELTEKAKKAGAKPPIVIVYGVSRRRGQIAVTPLHSDGRHWVYGQLGILKRSLLRVDSGDQDLDNKIKTVLDGLPAMLVARPSDWRLTALPSRPAGGRGWLIIGPDALLQSYILRQGSRND